MDSFELGFALWNSKHMMLLKCFQYLVVLKALLVMQRFFSFRLVLGYLNIVSSSFQSSGDRD